MRIGKLNKLLNLWEKNNLITNEQNKSISDFMKERQKENFFRLLKWLSIFGAFWVVVGVIATIINIFELDFMENILYFFINTFEIIYDSLILPIRDFIYNIFDDNSCYFYWSIISILLFCFFQYLSKRNKANENIDKLNLSDEQKSILKTNFVFDTIAAFSLAATFCFWNMLLIPTNSYLSDVKIFPLWNVIGAITFIALAYKNLKNMYLLFGIYFVALSVGMFHGYDFACYWIGVSRPIIQIFTGILLLLAGYITELKYTDNYIKEKFASTYNWTGLLMLFLALWIASLWGFEQFIDAGVMQLWFANVLFISASLLSMYYGAEYEHKIFFNYGLTFLIIETYTVFFARLWTLMPVGVACLLLGIMMLFTVKILKKIYMKKKI